MKDIFNQAEGTETASGLARRSIEGSVWVVALLIAQNVISIFVMGILARKLNPDIFGLLAVMGVFIGFLQMFSDMGFSSAIIQKRDLLEKDIRTAFSLTMIMGIVLFLITTLLSKPFSWFMNDDRIAKLLIVSGLSFFLTPFVSIQTALLQKNIEFRKKSIVQFITYLVYIMSALVMVYVGFEVWSLVLAVIVSTIVQIIILRITAGWRYRFGIDKNSFHSLAGFGVYMMLFRIIVYIGNSIDKIIIGKISNTAMVGYYNVADGASKKPITALSSPIGAILFPLLSKVGDDKEKRNRIVLKFIKVIVLISFPLMFGLMVVSKEVVILWLGENWIKTIPILQVLAVVGAMSPAGAIVGPVFLSSGRSDLEFKLGAFNIALRIICMLLGVRWGVMGIVSGLAVAQTVVFFGNLYMTSLYCGINYLKILGNPARVGIASAVMVTGILFIRNFIKGMNNLSLLLLFFTVGAALYYFSLALMGINIIDEIKVLKSYFNSRVEK